MSGDEDLCYHKAIEAIAQFTAKTLSPAELMRAIIARSEAVNPALNAVTATHYDHGLQQARVAEAVYMRADGNARPLEGVTIAIEDFHPVENQVTTFGSRICTENRTAVSAPTVKRLLDAGAIMHCRTTTPEFALGLLTYSA